MRRKGELSGGAIDRGWPHQVAIAVYDRHGVRSGGDARRFCEYMKLSVCSRGHYVNDGNQDYNVYCFADAEHAAIFRKAMDGEDFDPRERGRGVNWMAWRKGSVRK
jgi:hypothetical protein